MCLKKPNTFYLYDFIFKNKKYRKNPNSICMLNYIEICLLTFVSTKLLYIFNYRKISK